MVTAPTPSPNSTRSFRTGDIVNFNFKKRKSECQSSVRDDENADGSFFVAINSHRQLLHLKAMQEVGSYFTSVKSSLQVVSSRRTFCSSKVASSLGRQLLQRTLSLKLASWTLGWFVSRFRHVCLQQKDALVANSSKYFSRRKLGFFHRSIDSGTNFKNIKAVGLRNFKKNNWLLFDKIMDIYIYWSLKNKYLDS